MFFSELIVSVYFASHFFCPQETWRDFSPRPWRGHDRISYAYRPDSEDDLVPQSPIRFLKYFLVSPRSLGK